MSRDTQRTPLELAHLWADFTSKVLGAIALLVAAWWTYTNFTVERTHDPTMEVSVEPSIHPLEGKKVLLNVDVFMRNIGKVAIVPRFPEKAGDEDLGLEISIVEIEPLGRDATGVRQASHAEPAPAEAVEAAATDEEPAVPWFDWTSGDGSPRPILRKRNLLADNVDFQKRRYQLNPGVRYREPFACVVDRDKLYAIRARFWTDEGSVADLVYVDTYRPSQR